MINFSRYTSVQKHQRILISALRSILDLGHRHAWVRYSICWSREYRNPTSEITNHQYDCKLRQTFAFGAQACRARLFLVLLLNTLTADLLANSRMIVRQSRDSARKQNVMSWSIINSFCYRTTAIWLAKHTYNYVHPPIQSQILVLDALTHSQKERLKALDVKMRHATGELIIPPPH